MCQAIHPFTYSFADVRHNNNSQHSFTDAVRGSTTITPVNSLGTLVPTLPLRCHLNLGWIGGNFCLIMLVSHCGEYMANGLTNAVRHEFVMIANNRQTFVAVRKHSRSFLWCFECYAGLTSGECMANGLTNAIRHQFAMIAK